MEFLGASLKSDDNKELFDATLTEGSKEGLTIENAAFSELDFLVFDEADRMVESGHFQEVESILSLLPTKYISLLYRLKLHSEKSLIKTEQQGRKV